MTGDTLQKIHEEYLNAVKSSKDILSITKNFYDRLSQLNYLTIPEVDRHQFDSFLKGIEGCVCYREQTSDFSTLIDGLKTTIDRIITFMTKCKGKDWNVSIAVRLKALKREFIKILRKSIESEETLSIRDRFGIRFVLNNNFDERLSNSKLLEIYNATIGILCGTNRQLRAEFLDFVTGIDNPLIKFQIDTIMKLPLTADNFKNYVVEPKPDSGYQSIHVSIRVESYSNLFAGAQIELQFRTKEMDKKWNHLNYEEQIPAEIREVFTIPKEVLKSLNISGFDPDIPKDLEGFLKPKMY